MWSSSSARSKPASGVVVTSTPCSRRPAATPSRSAHPGGSESSGASRLPCRKELLELGRGDFAFILLDEPTLVLDGGLNLVPVIVVVGEGRMDLGEGNRRIGGGDLGRGHPHLLVPDGDMPDLDAVAEDVGLPAAVAGAYPDIFRDDRQGCRLVVRLGRLCGDRPDGIDRTTKRGSRARSMNRRWAGASGRRLNRTRTAGPGLCQVNPVERPQSPGIARDISLGMG